VHDRPTAKLVDGQFATKAVTLRFTLPVDLSFVLSFF